MTTRHKMTMRCTIQRNAIPTNSWGAPGAPGWVDHIVNLPCFVWVRAGREVVDSKVVVVLGMQVFVPSGSDVTEKDRILSVKNRKLEEVFSGPMDIKAVVRRPHHVELETWTLR